MSINDKLRDLITEGDIVIAHHTNFDYSKRIGEPFKVVVLWKEFRGQPLVLKCEDLKNGKYIPKWLSYWDVVEIIGHIDLMEIFSERIGEDK